jgi:MerR family transcriptional regulator, light-induced transcriptional regulator
VKQKSKPRRGIDASAPTRTASDVAGPQARAARLIRAIEGDIIPRLMLMHRSEAPAAHGDTGATHESPAFTAGDVEHFAALVLAEKAPAAALHVRLLRARGVPLETILLELLAPVARYLGRQWESDQADFMQVTLGLWQLQQLLHELGHESVERTDPGDPVHRALFAPAPGEQHTFGLMIVSEFFRRAGWEVVEEVGATRETLLELVRRERFTLVGLSVSCEDSIDGVAALIGALRRASCNRALGVMVGGPPFLDHPERVAMVGADATAADGRQAAMQARSLLAVLGSGA